MNSPLEDLSVVPKTGLSRRTLISGAAWSVPVIAIAVAAPAASASVAAPPPTTSAMRISFNNFGFSNSGKELDAGIQFIYVDYRNTISLTSVTMQVTLPKADYTGAYTITLGANWSGAAATSSGINWIITFTFAKTLFQSDSTGNLRAIFTTIPDTVSSGAPAGTTQTGTAYAIDSMGSITPVIAASSHVY
ncbi:hypothetical protein [Subtercola lobariae]|uniref:Uncharacterized protein n=1 Tax=Subtercola lobariae TaxID=1588641 RepID=A0A917AZM1_9MICO|nr:hypothetical protein [Subtercola lobariae]GGF13059.1 hypothetical protein GCM10011399_03710 [Subtercola lobariae]